MIPCVTFHVIKTPPRPSCQFQTYFLVAPRRPRPFLAAPFCGAPLSFEKSNFPWAATAKLGNVAAAMKMRMLIAAGIAILVIIIVVPIVVKK